MFWIKHNFVLLYLVAIIVLVLGAMPLGYLIGVWVPGLHPLITTPLLSVGCLVVLLGFYPTLKYRVTGHNN